MLSWVFFFQWKGAKYIYISDQCTCIIHIHFSYSPSSPPPSNLNIGSVGLVFFNIKFIHDTFLMPNTSIMDESTKYSNYVTNKIIILILRGSNILENEARKSEITLKMNMLQATIRIIPRVTARKACELKWNNIHI